jgi:hypothetical protein
MRKSAITLESETSKAELETLTMTLSTAGLRGSHLEIGTAAGGTLKELMRLYPNEKRPRFVVLDPMTYFPNQREIIERNLRDAGLDPSGVEFRIGYSWPLFAEAFPNERYSFIFIDGNHGAEGAMRDLAWTRMLETGGLVALHDHGPKFPGVVWAVAWFLRKQPNYTKVAEAETLVILRKNATSPIPEVSEFDLRLARALQLPLKWRRSIRKRLAPKPNRG